MNKMIAPFLLVLVSCIPSFSQTFDIATYNGWLIENKSALWQKVYTDSTVTPETMIAHLKKFSWIRNVEQRNGTIYAHAVDYRMDFKKYRYSLDIPVIFKSSTFNWSMAIDFKPGKYRVTVSSITYSPDDSFYTPGVTSPEKLVYDHVVLIKKRTSFRERSLRNLRSFSRDLNEIYTVEAWQTSASTIW